MERAVIAGYVRSPFQPARRGSLARVRPDDLAAAVVAALVDRTGVEPAAIEDVTLGCAFPEGEQGMNLGRIVAVLAGLPRSVGGSTVNRFCGSSMQSVHTAARIDRDGRGRRLRLRRGRVDEHGSRWAASTRCTTRRWSSATPTSTCRWARPPRTSPSATTCSRERPGGASRCAASRRPPRRPRQGRLADETRPIGECHGRRLSAPGHDAEGLAALKPAFRRRRHGHRRHLVAADRRRGGRAGHLRGLRARARPRAARRGAVVRDLGLRSRR